jgi:hypothetical protein
MTQGDLYAFCEVGVQKVTGQNYPILENYKAAIIGASTDCIESLHRAQVSVDVLFQPTAVNTLANHINCLEGKEDNERLCPHRL